MFLCAFALIQQWVKGGKLAIIAYFFFLSFVNRFFIYVESVRHCGQLKGQLTEIKKCVMLMVYHTCGVVLIGRR